MKEIIQRFTDRYKDINFAASYCDVADLNSVVETNLERRHLIISNFRQDLNIIRSDHALAELFEECTERLEFDGAVYLHEQIVDESQFIVVINLKTGEFKTVGHTRRSQLLAVLDRLSVILDALKFYNSQNSIDAKVLNATYPWLDFSWRGINHDKFDIEGRSSEVSGWFIIDKNDSFDINCSLDKKTIRSMKRHLPKEVKHRRTRQILKSKYRLMRNSLSEFEKYLINAQTGPVKKGDLEWLLNYLKH